MTTPLPQATKMGARMKKPPPVRRGDLYYLPGTDPLPSVTSVLQESAKPALVSWAARTAAAKALADPSLSVDDAAAAIYQTSKKAMGLGSTVHSWAEAASQGNVEEIPQGPVNPYAKAWSSWFETYKPEFLHTERIVANFAHGYAGTADAIIRDQSGHVVIVDYKTGKAVYEEAAFQVSAYLHADRAFTPYKEPVDLPQADYSMIVHLKEDGTYAVHIMPDTFDVFLAYLHIYRRRRGRECPAACPIETSEADAPSARGDLPSDVPNASVSEHSSRVAPRTSAGSSGRS